MKKLSTVMCCLLLAGCAGVSSWSGVPGVDPMQSDGHTYVPVGAGTYDPPPEEQRPVSTCTMRGQNVVCR